MRFFRELRNAGNWIWTFTKKILNRKLHFCSVSVGYISSLIFMPRIIHLIHMTYWNLAFLNILMLYGWSKPFVTKIYCKILIANMWENCFQNVIFLPFHFTGFSSVFKFGCGSYSWRFTHCCYRNISTWCDAYGKKECDSETFAGRRNIR